MSPNTTRQYTTVGETEHRPKELRAIFHSHAHCPGYAMHIAVARVVNRMGLRTGSLRPDVALHYRTLSVVDTSMAVRSARPGRPSQDLLYTYY